MTTKKILLKAGLSRLVVIALQFAANHYIPTYKANAFRYPRRTDDHRKFWDELIFRIFGGLIRWDGQHFMQIAIHGYTYEDSLAYFPLLPYSVRYLAKVLPLPFLTFESRVLLTFVVFNFVIFMLAAVTLYKLTECWFGTRRAEIATMLFCINPASIFFSAAYTESLFALLTFLSIFTSWKINFESFLVSAQWLFLSCLLITLSSLTRSNGLLNLGFLVYFFVRSLRHNLELTNSYRRTKVKKICYNTLILLISIAICVVPFIWLQYYQHSNFCFDKSFDLPKEVINYARGSGQRLVGQFYNQSWCDFKYIPQPYSYLQQKYFNVSFLQNSLQNVLLPLPVIYITWSESIKFLYQNRGYFRHLGMFKSIHDSYVEKARKDGIDVSVNRTEDKCDKDVLFVCIEHALFFSVICISVIHLPVITRIMFSSNPAIYWLASNKNKIFMKIYCYSYCIVGIVMFSNFLPWS